MDYWGFWLSQKIEIQLLYIFGIPKIFEKNSTTYEIVMNLIDWINRIAIHNIENNKTKQKTIVPN